MGRSLVSYFINFISYEDLKNPEGYPVDPEPGNGDIQMEYSSD